MAKRALIVGGGIGGMSCAIALRRIDWSVDLVDIDPAWRALGAGLTLSGPALRAFGQLGVLDPIKAGGFFSPNITLVDQQGSIIGKMPVPECEPGIPGLGGILRPVLHQILAERVKVLGVGVRLGIGVKDVWIDTSPTRVLFSDDSEGEYDLVIGSDSLNSNIRKRLFGDAYKPRFTGLGCWRLLTPKPREQEGMMLCGTGPHVGLNPVSQTHMYMFITVPDPDKSIIPDDEQIQRLREVLADFGGPVAEIRERMDSSYLINYRPLETLLVDEPWHRGRVLLIGDAAHATTPHLGHGAGLAVEDTVVLGEELNRSADLGEAFDRFMIRRLNRSRQVIEASLRISEFELDRNWPACLPLQAQASAKLLEPI